MQNKGIMARGGVVEKRCPHRAMCHSQQGWVGCVATLTYERFCPRLEVFDVMFWCFVMEDAWGTVRCDREELLACDLGSKDSGNLSTRQFKHKDPMGQVGSSGKRDLPLR